MFLTTQSVNRLFMFSDLIPQTTQKCRGILVWTMSTRSAVAVAAHTRVLRQVLFLPSLLLDGMRQPLGSPSGC